MTENTSEGKDGTGVVYAFGLFTIVVTLLLIFSKALSEPLPMALITILHILAFGSYASVVKQLHWWGKMTMWIWLAFAVLGVFINAGFSQASLLQALF